MKKLLFLLAFVLFATSGYSQKLKIYYIKANGEKTSKLYAKFKRTVQNQNDIWVVRDYYLNDSIRMSGHFQDKNLTQKTDTIIYYYPNGKLSSTAIYKNNALNGNHNSYYVTGSLSKSGNYDMNVPTGEWIWYKEDGTIESKLENINPNIFSKNYSPAAYIGGNLKEYLNKVNLNLNNGNLSYNGNIITTFQINEEGDVTEVDIILHGTKEMDSALIKHLYNMPKWRAQKKNGKYVTSNYILPIILNNQSKKINDSVIAEAFFNSGGLDYKEGNYEKAVFKFINSIGYNHMEAKYYFFLGHSYYNLNKPDFACAEWSVANSLDSTILKKKIKDLCNLK
jgi:antitoxin component YwqK of YwqJK toxin-antitoxin module